MAGIYPDAPGNRIAYDEDGTQVFFNLSDYTGTSNIDLMNDESNSVPWGAYVGASFTWFYVTFYFPRLMDIYGWRGSSYTQCCGISGGFSISTDSTAPDNGTWTSIPGGWNGNGMGGAEYRNNIQSGLHTGVRALKFGFAGYGDMGTYGVHLYGKPSAGTNVDRLELWHPTLPQRVPPAYFDFGDIARGTTTDKQFRVKNLSDTLTANSIALSIDALTDTAPSVPGMHFLSDNGTTFNPTLNIGTLFPGQLSAPLTLRQVVPVNAQLSLWAIRVKAIPGTWT